MAKPIPSVKVSVWISTLLYDDLKQVQEQVRKRRVGYTFSNVLRDAFKTYISIRQTEDALQLMERRPTRNRDDTKRSIVEPERKTTKRVPIT